MKPVSSTEIQPLEMIIKDGSSVGMFRLPTSKLGWLHSKTEKTGVSFDISIRDALGRVVYEKQNCKTETDQFGEFLNKDMRMGEELEISLDNVKGTEKVHLFLN